MKNENYQQLAQELLNYGKQKGADQMQISIAKGTEFGVEVREGNIEKLTEAGSKSLSLKVIIDNKVAVASSSDFTTAALNKLIDNAVARAKLTSSDPFSGLPEKEEPFVEADMLQLYDESIPLLTPEAKIKIAKDVEAIALSDKRIKKSSGSSFGSDTAEYVLANSNGFNGKYRISSCSFGVGLQAGEGDKLFEDGWYSSSLNFKGLKSAEEIAKIAVERTTRLIGARKIPSQNVPIIFEPTMTSSILGFLYSCITGGAIYMKQSFLVDKLGEKIANSLVNITDDPHIAGALGSRPYDGEGVPTRKKSIIGDGVLKSYMLDTYSGRKLKMHSTGNASGPGNFYLHAGTHTPQEIIKSVDKGLLLTKTIGQGTVATTGDISKGAFGLWIEKGEIVFPVAEITISGNLGKMLNSIEMIGNDLTFDRSITGPTIKIGEMTISGL